MWLATGPAARTLTDADMMWLTARSVPINPDRATVLREVHRRDGLLHRSPNLVPLGIHALLIGDVIATLRLPPIPLTGASP
jgi:hypothetical protein